MTSSPYNDKKARASLTCNISNFFEPAESSTVDLSENFSSEEVNLDTHACENEPEKAIDVEDQLFFAKTLGRDFQTEKRNSLGLMSQIFLFAMNARRASRASQRSRMSQLSQAVEPVMTYKFAGKKPLIIGEIPQPFYLSKCFQTFDSHNSQDLAILNLYDTAKLIKPFDQDILVTRLLASETFLGSVSIGKGRLDGYFIASDLSSQVCVYETESRKRLRKYNIVKPSKNFASRIQQEKTQIYCGLTDGSIRIFDIRMKANISHLTSDTPSKGNSPQNDFGVFNPITSLELGGSHYLLSTSTNKVCLWDLRQQNKEVGKVQDLFGEGLLKALFHPSKSHHCMAMYYGEQELKEIDMMTGRMETLLRSDDPIYDFQCYGDSKAEIFILTDKGNHDYDHDEFEIEGEKNQDFDMEEDQNRSRVKAEINIYNLGNDGVDHKERIEMGKDYKDLKINGEGTRLWALSARHLALWDHDPKKDSRMDEEEGIETVVC